MIILGLDYPIHGWVLHCSDHAEMGPASKDCTVHHKDHRRQSEEDGSRIHGRYGLPLNDEMFTIKGPHSILKTTRSIYHV